MVILFVLCLILSPEDYINNIKSYVELSDITGGLIKARRLALYLPGWEPIKDSILGGARGVGIATTQSVVIVRYSSL